MEKGRLDNPIAIAERVYHVRDTFLGSRLRDQPARSGWDVILESSCLDP
jgi:hypothetical protein